MEADAASESSSISYREALQDSKELGDHGRTKFIQSVDNQMTAAVMGLWEGLLSFARLEIMNQNISCFLFFILCKSIAGIISPTV